MSNKRGRPVVRGTPEPNRRKRCENKMSATLVVLSVVLEKWAKRFCFIQGRTGFRHVEAPGQPSVVELPYPRIPNKSDKTFV